jgi:hypothetical protein
MHKFNNYTGFGEILCAAMILSYFTIFFLESLIMRLFPQVGGIFVPTLA